jgi:hypothetical protein
MNPERIRYAAVFALSTALVSIMAAAQYRPAPSALDAIDADVLIRLVARALDQLHQPFARGDFTPVAIMCEELGPRAQVVADDTQLSSALRSSAQAMANALGQLHAELSLIPA